MPIANKRRDMNTLKSALLTIGGLAVAGGASAQAAPNFYVSVSGGPSRINTDCSGTTSCDNSSVAAKGLLGYKLMPNLAVEAHFAYLGKATATIDGGEGGSIDVSIKGRSIGLGVAALIPFGASKEWTGIARIGIASNRTTATAASASDSDTKTEPYFGLGLNYAVSSAFDVGIAWDATKLSYAGQKANVNSFNIVGTLKF